jgi:hypothetical protein
MVEAPDQFSQLLADFARDPMHGRPLGEEPPMPHVVRSRRRWWRRRQKTGIAQRDGSIPRRSVS